MHLYDYGSFAKPGHHFMARELHLPAGLPDSAPQWLRSYPAHLSQDWELPSGQSLLLRPIRHDDDEREEAFVLALSAESRYQRMLSAGIKITPEWIESLTHIDYRRHMAFVLTTEIDGAEQFIGVGRYVVDASTNGADLGIVLADAWQGKGLGRRLLAALMEHARAAGISEMVGVVLATNVTMLRLVRSMGFSVGLEPGDATVRRIRCELGTLVARPH
jgi:acetyltransferase